MAIRNLVFVLVLSVGLCSQHVLAQAGMGPLNIDLVRASKCRGSEASIVDMEVVDVDGNKKGLNINIDLPFALDPTVSYTVRVDKVANGHTQEGVFRHGGPYLCQDMEKFLGDVWNKIIKAMNAPEGCPKAAGKYSAEKFPFDYKDLKVDKFLYGRFLLNFEFAQSGQKKGCLVIEFTNSRPGESV